MLTPAQEHFQRVMAQRRGESDTASCATRTAHEEILHRLRLAQSRLKGIQSRAAKAEVKKTLLPEFSGWIEGTLESDSGRQDEVIVTLMVWAVDCGDLALALRLGAYVVRHRLTPPDNFGRDAATLLTEEICNPILTLASTEPNADLSGFIAPLDALWDIVRQQDMPDEVRAKLCKASAFSRRASTDPQTQGDALKLLREAMHFPPGAGVKREIATLARRLEKPPGEAGTKTQGAVMKKAPRKAAAGKTSARKATKGVQP